jgi:peptide-methionine (R)-S-oxide reductase
MMNRRSFLRAGATLGALAVATRLSPAVALAGEGAADKKRTAATSLKKVTRSDAEWRQILTPEQYRVARQAGTEAPYSSPLLKVHERGVFECVCCDLPLFDSRTKFESGTGWPSFWQPIDKRHVAEHEDTSLGGTRTEVLCARCDAHLGHVFDDGPRPTGLRYCMNGVALKFVKNGR